MNTIKLSWRSKMVWFVRWDPCYYSSGFDFKFWFKGPVSRTSRSHFGPVKLFYVCSICLPDGRFSSFKSNTIKLSENETKRSSLWARTGANTRWVLILNSGFGPEKLPVLSRNGPQARKAPGTFEKRAPAPTQEWKGIPLIVPLFIIETLSMYSYRFDSWEENAFYFIVVSF